MKTKRLLSSAMAAVCLTGSLLSAAPAAMAIDGYSPWLDLTLKSSDYYVKPGDTFTVDVNAGNPSGRTANLGGGQLNLHIFNSNQNGSELEIVSIDAGKDNTYKQFIGNKETGEAVFSFPANGKDLKATDNSALVTYTFKVPDDTPEKTTFVFSLDLASYFVDGNGDELQTEMAFANLMINVDSETVNEKSMYFNAGGNNAISAVGGKEFDVPVKIYGSNIDTLSGFQLKLDVPEGVEYTGADMTNIPGDVALEFNPDTLEIAAAKKSGEAIGFKSGDTVAVLKFKTKSDYTGTFSIGVKDVYGTAADKTDFIVRDSRSAKVHVVPNDLRFVLNYSDSYKGKANAFEGQELVVPIVIQGGAVETLAGFQLKLDVSDDIEYVGADMPAIGDNVNLEFNPETLEIAAAKKSGEPIGLKDDDTIAVLKFKVKSPVKDGNAYIKITDVFGTDTDQTEDIIKPSIDLELVIADPVPDTPVEVETGLLGDVNLDGAVDAKDASAVLAEYAALSTGNDSSFTEQQNKNADVNFDGAVNASDASKILAFYSFLSTGGSGRMEDWLADNK
jgi:hypothetical protein